MTVNCPPQRSTVAKSCKKSPPPFVDTVFLVGCCIGWARGGRLRLTPGSSLSLFHCPIRRPKRQEKVHSTGSASVASHHHRPPSIAAKIWLIVGVQLL